MELRDDSSPTIRLLECKASDVRDIEVVYPDGSKELYSVYGKLPVASLRPLLLRRTPDLPSPDIIDDAGPCMWKPLCEVRGVLKITAGAAPVSAPDADDDEEVAGEASETGPGRNYQFIIESDECELFVLDSDTVSDVKRKIAKLEFTSPDLVSISVAGRQLNDDVVLSRLRIPSHVRVMALIQDVSEIMLRTAKALQNWEE